jgi:4-amino-4-deoxy-L-arabinose transferase-like glycosyltransferase
MIIQSGWLSIYIAIIGTIISALLAYLSYTLNRQSQRASMQRSIEDLYDGMIKYRAAHPEVMKLCGRWNNDRFAAVYRQHNAKEVQWVIYYNYVELVSGFVNAVLYGRKNKLLDRHAYEGHYKPLVMLLVTEHYLYFLSILQGPYLSSFIKEFIFELKEQGWDLAEKHGKLIGTVSSTESKPPPKNRTER